MRSARIPPNPPNPGQNDPVPGQTSLQGPENPAVEAVRTPSPYLYPSGKPAEGLVRRRGSRCVFPFTALQGYFRPDVRSGKATERRCEGARDQRFDPTSGSLLSPAK